MATPATLQVALDNANDPTTVTEASVFVGGTDTGLNVLIAADPVKDVDVMFILICTALVFFMHCGFAMLSVGAVRDKNAKNILLKILLDACIGCIAFYTLGFGFAYGGDYGPEGRGNGFVGFGGFALNAVPKSEWYFFFFQYAFAATAATIVSGAIAERTKFEAYLIYAVFLTAWVYPVVVHWVWSGTGWLSAFKPSGRLFGTGVIDFAGCSPVHMVGGVSGLAGAKIIGPRIGRFVEGKPVPMPGHNASLAILGVFVLWFGWYGFNPGSALVILNASHIAALAAVNTTISAATGTLSTLVILMLKEYYKSGEVEWDLLESANGTLAGLVGITGACSVVEPWSAIIIGIMSGGVYVWASGFIINRLGIDDPLDAGAVHAFTGGFGLLMPSFFATRENVIEAYGPEIADGGYGLVMGGGFSLLGCAIVTLLVTIVWTLGHMVPFFAALRSFDLLRVSEEEERYGLDISHHGGPAYFQAQGTEFVDVELEDIRPDEPTRPINRGNDSDLLNRVVEAELQLDQVTHSMKALQQAFKKLNSMMGQMNSNSRPFRDGGESENLRNSRGPGRDGESGGLGGRGGVRPYNPPTKNNSRGPRS